MEQPFDEDSGEEEFDPEQKMTIRKLLPTINIPFKSQNDPIIFSYHYKYEKYLRDNNLIDPEKAKQMLEKQKRKIQENKDKNAKAEKEAAKEGKEGGAMPPPLPDGEDLSGDCDDSYGGGNMNGKYRFDQLIKTMIARIEYNNTLAPVQEYGRHQTKALKNKKKGKTEDASAPGEPANPATKKGKKDFDDRFYDLDDNFIDDGDMEDEYGANGLDGMGAGGYDQMMNDDFYNEDDNSTTNNN